MPRHKTLEESFNDVNEDAGTQFLKEAAKREGLPWHKYCEKWGIAGEANRKKHNRHEDWYQRTDNMGQETES